MEVPQTPIVRQVKLKKMQWPLQASHRTRSAQPTRTAESMSDDVFTRVGVRRWRTQRGGNRRELRQRSLQLLDDLLGDNVRVQQGVPIAKRFVLNICIEVQVRLVACQQFIDAVRLEGGGRFSSNTGVAGPVRRYKVVEVLCVQRPLLQREMLVGAEIVYPQC